MVKEALNPNILVQNLCNNKVHIWLINLSGSYESNLLTSVLSPDELRRGKLFKLFSAQRQFYMTRFALRKILSYYTSTPPEDISIGYKRFGKPFLMENPYGINFNVSHSCSLALCAVTTNAEVGVDIEIEGLPNTVGELTGSVFSTNEMEEFFTLTSSLDRLQYFYRAWVRKEAYVKALGKGLYADIRNVDLSHVPYTEERVILIPVENESCCRWYFRDLHWTFENTCYYGAVFVKNSCGQVNFTIYNYDNYFTL